jgi:hypothetical protein
MSWLPEWNAQMISRHEIGPLCVSLEEQQEATSIVINRSAVLLNHSNTLDNVGQAELFATGQKRYPLGGQELLEVGGDFLGNGFGFAIVREVGV